MRAMLVVILLVLAVQVANATTIYVPDDYPAIQQAVNNAVGGDIIVIRDGVYEENVDVDVSVTIKSENGSARCVVRAYRSSDNVFEVNADGVEITGLTIEGATGKNKAGVRLKFVNNCMVKDCVIRKCNLGIYVRGTAGNTAQNNRIINCSISECNSGIKLSGKGCGCEVLSNGVFDCSSHGIVLVSADGNEVRENNICNNECGIHLQNADSNNISCNWIHGNDVGIYLSDKGGSSTDNIISHNNIIQNGQFNPSTESYQWQLYNDQHAEVDARNNYWGLFNNESIDASIYDDDEDSRNGEVNFYPFLTGPAPSAPIPELATPFLISAGIACIIIHLKRKD